MIYLLVSVLSFISIFGRSFQQQNVIYKRRVLILPTSYFLATSEMFTIGLFAQTFITETLVESLIMAFCVGTSAGLGSLASLSFHAWVYDKFFNKEG